MSLNILFLLAAFIIHTAEGVKAYCLSLVGTLIMASIVFVLFPGDLGFERVSSVAGYEALFKSIHEIDNPFNLFPLLHVTYSTLSALAMIDHSKSSFFKYFMFFWIVLISLSLVLVHQHHIFDIVSGFFLAWIGYRFIYKKIMEKA